MKRSAAPDSLARLRRLCLALPEAHEVEAWGTPTFRVKTIFAMYAGPGNHHHAGRAGVWLKSAPANQALMVRAAPDRFFVPPYVGPSGWIGVYLDSARTDWEELAELLRDAWRLSAPKKLVARVEAGDAATKKAPAKKTPVKKAAAKKVAAKKRAPAARKATKRRGG